MKELKITKTVNEIKLGGVWGNLEAKNIFQGQSFTRYLRNPSFRVK